MCSGAGAEGACADFTRDYYSNIAFEGIQAPGETKVRSIKDACATHVNVCADMTLNSALEHTQ